MAGHPSVPYVLPFAVFVVLLAIQHTGVLPSRVDLPLRVVVLSAVLIAVSRPVVSFRARVPLASIAIGLAVFVIWIGPDLLFPHYRQNWLFQNRLMGSLGTSLAANLRSDPLSLGLRTFRAVVLVPIIEELFWRGWLMRWLIDPVFERLPVGSFTVGSFCIVALLFASEHGPFWDVGLAAGLIYNWWVVRTRSLADCILAHAVTNACLCAYVIAAGQWQYWL